MHIICNISRVNSLGNTNFWYGTYYWNMFSISCVECNQKYFEKKILKKKLWFSSKIEFSSKIRRFRSSFHPLPLPDLSRIEALTFTHLLSPMRGRPDSAPKRYEHFSDRHFRWKFPREFTLFIDHPLLNNFPENSLYL